MTNSLSLSAQALHVTISELLLSLGCPTHAQTPEMRSAASDALEHAATIAQPRAEGRLFSITHQNGSPALNGSTLVLPGRDIANHLINCDHCILMAVTLGLPIERELIRLSHDPTKAIYFDAACSLLIESAADQAESIWLAEIAHVSTVYRYSPGYGDLPLSIQPQMLNLLNAGQTLGITLTDSGLMIPRKSISALIGIR